jgi:hypothetical protein
MMQKAAAYANSRLHAVKAEVVVLARFVRYPGSHSRACRPFLPDCGFSMALECKSQPSVFQ